MRVVNKTVIIHNTIAIMDEIKLYFKFLLYRKSKNKIVADSELIVKIPLLLL